MEGGDGFFATLWPCSGANDPCGRWCCFNGFHQPYVTTSVLNSLLRHNTKTGQPVIASTYGDMFGTPAFFHKSLFAELMELKGDTGAGNLIRKHKELVATAAFPGGIIDIDTQMDYEAQPQRKTDKCSKPCY